MLVWPLNPSTKLALTLALRVSPVQQDVFRVNWFSCISARARSRGCGLRGGGAALTCEAAAARAMGTSHA